MTPAPPQTLDLAKLKEAAQLVKKRAWEDPHVYLFGDQYQRGLVKTLDEHDFDNPVKPLPDRPPLRALTDWWMEEQQLIIAKSRQLMISWGCLSLINWECWHPGRLWGVTCKRFDDADGLLGRIYHIYQNVPKGIRPKVEKKKGVLTVSTDAGPPSTIMALSQDSDAPRSRTFSGLYIDEAAFTDNLSWLYASAKPTVQGGGKVVLTSSPNGVGFFTDLLTDTGRIDIEEVVKRAGWR